MSYARLSRRPLLFKSFTGLEITEFDIMYSDEEYWHIMYSDEEYYCISSQCSIAVTGSLQVTSTVRIAQSGGKLRNRSQETTRNN
jgi:hypothetical protein